MTYQKMTFQKWEMQYEVIDLEEFGISNVAFDLPSAVSFMWEAAREGCLILGGDIIIPCESGLTESFDNWYSKEKTPMGTLQDAIRYLSAFWERNDSNWYVSVVLSER